MIPLLLNLDMFGDPEYRMFVDCGTGEPPEQAGDDKFLEACEPEEP